VSGLEPPDALRAEAIVLDVLSDGRSRTDYSGSTARGPFRHLHGSTARRE
jgi:hypothetical protein